MEAPSLVALLAFTCVFRSKPFALWFCIMRYGFSHSRVVYAVPSALLLLLNEIHVNACSEKRKKGCTHAMSHHYALCRYALILIASYNVWDLIGRYIPLIEQIKLRSRKGLLIAVDRKSVV